MPPTTIDDCTSPVLSDFRNYLAIRAALDLGRISESEARECLGLGEDESLDEIKPERLQGYEDAFLSGREFADA